MLSRIVVVLMLFVLQGCVSAPAIKPFSLSKGDKVGILVEIGDQVSHKHIGTTVFNNFEKDYSVSWALSDYINLKLRNKLESAGYQAVDLTKHGVTYAQVSNVVEIKSNQWGVNSDKKQIYQKLVSDLGLKALITIDEDKVVAMMECTGGPCSNRMMQHSGLFTRSMFFLTTYFAVAAVDTNIFILEPPMNLFKTNEFIDFQRARSVQMKGYSDPVDFKNLSAAELQVVESNVKAYLDKLIDTSVATLNKKQ